MKDNYRPDKKEQWPQTLEDAWDLYSFTFQKFKGIQERQRRFRMLRMVGEGFGLIGRFSEEDLIETQKCLSTFLSLGNYPFVKQEVLTENLG